MPKSAKNMNQEQKYHNSFWAIIYKTALEINFFWTWVSFKCIQFLGNGQFKTYVLNMVNSLTRSETKIKLNLRQLGQTMDQGNHWMWMKNYTH